MAIGIEIGIYLKTHPIGRITGEAGGFIISRQPDTLFCPDVGFIRRERLVDGRLPDSFVDIYPDLAVEVHSPSDRIIDDERKIQRYLAAGTSLVWHVNPKTNIVTVHRLGQTPRRFTVDDRLSGEDVLPCFALPVRSIFE
jgi:Uma2 family endonuclease